MSIELCGKMYSMDDAFVYGEALVEANGGGVVSIRPVNGMLVVTVVNTLGEVAND
jgi:hypothetical protein